MIWVYTVYLGLSVPILKVNTAYLNGKGRSRKHECVLWLCSFGTENVHVYLMYDSKEDEGHSN